jgi:hypothetical protein
VVSRPKGVAATTITVEGARCHHSHPVTNAPFAWCVAGEAAEAPPPVRGGALGWVVVEPVDSGFGAHRWRSIPGLTAFGRGGAGEDGGGCGAVGG